MQQKADQTRAEDPVEKIHACSTNSSAKNKRFIQQFPAGTPLSTRLWLSIQLIQTSALQFFWETSYCTTVRGSDMLRNVIVIFSGYVTFHQINTINTYYFFITGKMCFVAGWNCFAGRIWPAGRSVENPDRDYEEEWWQHTIVGVQHQSWTIVS